MIPSTDTQRAVLRFVFVFTSMHGYPPTIREVAHAFRRSVNTIHQTVQRLVRDGQLSHEPHLARSLVVLHPPAEQPTRPTAEQQRIAELEREVSQLRSLLVNLGAKVNKKR